MISSTSQKKSLCNELLIFKLLFEFSNLFLCQKSPLIFNPFEKWQAPCIFFFHWSCISFFIKEKIMNICRECNKNFSNKYILATHLRNIHGPQRERNFCCNFEASGVKCTKRFMTKHHLAKVKFSIIFMFYALCCIIK